MKPKHWIYSPYKRVPAGAALVCIVAVARTTHAQQQVLAPEPVYSVTPPAMQEYETNQPGALQVEQYATSPGTQPYALQWGELAVHPHLLYRFIYGNGIQSTPGQQQTTVYQQLAPGVLLGFGSHWTLDYTPLFSFYSSGSFQNSTDQSVALTWGTTYEDWVFGFSQGYNTSSAPLVQTGTQTDTINYSTTARASYHFSSMISVDMMVSQNFLFADQFTSTRGWSTMNWLNFDSGERWDVGIGAGYEYDDVNPGPNMMDEQFQGRFRWRTTDKITLSVHGGVEIQQYLDGGTSSLVTPVFGVSGQYQPTTSTTISLTADRSVAPSLFAGQVTETTSAAINLNQKLLTRLTLGASAGYGRTSYMATTITPTAGTGRLDNYYTFSVRLGTTFLQKGTASLFYQYSDNPSTQPGFSFTSSQVGIELGYRY